MRICQIKECPPDNKCETCPHKTTCDYYWVGKIWAKNDKLLTTFNPIWAKPTFKAGQIMTITNEHDFCIFNNQKNKDAVTIYDICVDEKARGKGIAKQIINELMEKFDKDIICKCIKGTSAESFWSHIGEKLYEEPGKQVTLCIYKVVNKNKKLYKVDLF